MTLTRLLPLALALASAGTLMACATAPAMPMGAWPGHTMPSPDRMAAMDAQMKTMQEMRTRMANAKTPEERQALMAEHMKAMQGGMGMMKGMAEMPGMGAMGDPKHMSAERAEHHKMMMQHMAMMQTMMDMMMQRMPPVAGMQRPAP